MYPEEFSVSGPPINPLGDWSYEEICDAADQLDLPDEDWDYINWCFLLYE